MAAGERNETEAAAAAAAPLLATARVRKLCKEGCPGCRLDEMNKTKTGIPYLNFFYVWVVCLCADRTQLFTPNYLVHFNACARPIIHNSGLPRCIQMVVFLFAANGCFPVLTISSPMRPFGTPLHTDPSVRYTLMVLTIASNSSDSMSSSSVPLVALRLKFHRIIIMALLALNLFVVLFVVVYCVS